MTRTWLGLGAPGLLAGLPAGLPACPSCLPACLPTYLPARPPAGQPRQPALLPDPPFPPSPFPSSQAVSAMSPTRNASTPTHPLAGRTPAAPSTPLPWALSRS